jgi:hypothetical protein
MELDETAFDVFIPFNRKLFLLNAGTRHQLAGQLSLKAAILEKRADILAATGAPDFIYGPMYHRAVALLEQSLQLLRLPPGFSRN